MTKIFVINLERNKERRETIEKQFKSYNITNYEFIKGIDGNTLTNDLISLNVKTRKNIDKKYKNHFSNKEIACLKSHALAISKAIKDKLDSVIILEDDIVICEDWNSRLDKLIKITPKKWNHIYLSGFPAGYDLIENQDQFNPLAFAPFLHVEKSKTTMGAFSYMLKKEVFNIVKKEYLSFTTPTDNIIDKLIKSGELISYSFFPYLTYHDNDIISEIWGSEYLVDHESKRYFINKL